MDRQDVLKRLLYPKCKSAIEFQFDSLMVNPLLSYITVQDIAQLNKIATSLKYSSKPKEKYAMIDNIMTNRGFKKMASGTNRVTYRCLNDYRVVIKIAIDKVGLSDNGNEYRNQQILKPFVTKCFEVSPCGTVGLFERVVPITSREEFLNISDDIFDLINNLIGKYVLEDIGEKFYMNYGLREGFGPVLLDYPYVFELDGRKLICNVPEPMSQKGYCGGEIDYDLGYNNLICKRCGKRYLATELKSDIKSDKPKIIIEGEDIIMRCVLTRGDEIVSELNSKEQVATNTIRSKKDFTRLKAQISVREEEKKEEIRKPVIKTHDEVNLKVKLRGTPSSKDIDKEAREKEEIRNKNTEFIPVYFKPEEKEPEKPVSDFSVSFANAEVVKQEEKQEEVKIEEAEVAVDTYESITVFINDDGEIINADNQNVIGYTKEAFLNKTKEIYNTKREVIQSAPETNNEEVVYSDENAGTTIGDLIGAKYGSKNENYKTTDIVSPIAGYFSNSNVTEPVEEKEEVKEEREIPEVIIYRYEDDEESYNDEDNDPEYSDSNDEEDTVTEDDLKLY